MEIANKVFIVTGGASGLGAGTVPHMLVANGARVVIADLQDEPGEALAKELGQRYVHATSPRKPTASAPWPPRASSWARCSAW